MLTKRIIPCLDIKDGRTVKGVNFEQIKDAGDPVELAVRYTEEGADELVFLDITATHEGRKTLIHLVQEIARNVNIPFTVGGGINEIQDVFNLLNAGTDKISINSSAVRKPQFIKEISTHFGAQCVVVAIDAQWDGSEWRVYTSGGRNKTERTLFDWAIEVEDLGAGEILFTSMNHDGTKKGFALETLQQLHESLTIPVIASGGAGTVQDFVEVFKIAQIDAALAASVFHYQEISIPDLKKELSINKIPVRL